MTRNTPGVELKTVDNSDYVSSFASTAFGILVKSNQGPLSVTPVSSQKQFLKLYGEPDINTSESHFHALKLLETNNNLLYCKRVQNNSSYAGCVFYQDKNKNPTKIESVDFPYATTESYENAGFRVVLLNLNDLLTINGSIYIVLNDSDGKSVVVEQEFDESHDNTIQLFTEKLKEKIKEEFNTDVEIIIKRGVEETISQPEIYKINFLEFIRDPEGLIVTIPIEVEPIGERGISFNIPDLSEPIVVTSTKATAEDLIADLIEKLNTNYGDFLVCEPTFEGFKMTAKSPKANYFTNPVGVGLVVNFTPIIPEYTATLSFRVPQLPDIITVTSNFRLMEDILLDFSSQISTSYSNYVIPSFDLTDNSLTLTAKINYFEYFKNISATGFEIETTKVQEGRGINSIMNLVLVAPVSSTVLYKYLAVVDADSIVHEQEIIQNTELFNIFAENPGSWGNKIGVSLNVSSDDTGTKELYSLLFKNNVPGIKLSGSFDLYEIDEDNIEKYKTRKTYKINTIEYTDSDEQFFNDIKDEFISKVKEDYIKYNGIEINDNIISFQSPKSGILLDLTNLVLSPIPGSASELIISKEVYNINGKDTFTINIYNRDDVTNPLESYKGSLYDIKDASNNQLNISEIINKTNPSDYIRIKQFNKSKDSGLEVLYSTDINILSKGDNGKTVTAGDYNNAMQDFIEEEVDIMALIDDGYNDSSVKQNLTKTAESLKAVALLSIPHDYTSKMELIKNYRNNKLGIDSCYAALLGPSLITIDNYSGNQISLTTGGYYAERVAYVEANYGRHQAVAGQKGSIVGILGLNKNYKDSEYGELYPNQVNLVRNINSAFQIDGIKTLQRRETAMQKLPVVLIKNQIDKKLCQVLRGFIYELNLPDTRFRVWSSCNDYLSGLKINNQISEYEVICDATNNSNADIDAGRLNVTVRFIPVSIVEYIYITLIIEKNGAIVSK